MSLQFVAGGSGTGKTYITCQKIIEESIAHPEGRYYIIVPEQFTMQTQKTLVEMHPGKGILNIDILSFDRLAHRVFEEVGGDNREILEDTGKSMVLRKMAQQHQKELCYLGSQMHKPGCLDEVKSLISEFMLYDIHWSEVEDLAQKSGDNELLNMKLRDVGVLYKAFTEYLEGNYMTGEEVMDVLLKVLPMSEKIKGSTILFDGFTGFTPIQVNVIRELLRLCEKVIVTVTMDVDKDIFAMGKPHHLFYMSRKMIHTLSGLTKDIDDPILLKSGKKSRYAQAPALAFLEKNLFRYKKGTYEEKPQEISVFSAATPLVEMRETARRIAFIVRKNGLRYGEIAVITGNLEEYGNLAEQVFEEADIPFFIDEKHSVLMNPFVECIRAALEMVVSGFPYESVFRYLRCGMSGLTRTETDKLENYVIALGIRGYKRWSEDWGRVYKGMQPGELEEINEIRERFAGEVKALAEGFLTDGRTVEDYCRSLYEFIAGSQMAEKLRTQEAYFKTRGDRALEKEYHQIYGIIMDLLDKMVEILGKEKVKRQEFRQLMETGLSKAKVALIPPSTDQVLVGDMERTRLKDIRALFFVGVNEGNIPKNTDAGGILTEMDRELLDSQGMELAPGPKELMNSQRFYLYLNLTKPREFLMLSFSEANSKGEKISPAYLINTIKGMFPGLIVKKITGKDNIYPELPGTAVEWLLSEMAQDVFPEENPLFLELYSWYMRSPEYRPLIQRLTEAFFAGKPADIISQSVAKALYGEISPHGATRLEKFAACAFAHFLRYGLRLTERTEYEFRPMDMGNIMHRALEDFAHEIAESKADWKDLSDAERETIADRCLDRIVGEYGNTILHSSARNEYMIERTRRLLRRTVWALQKHLEQGEFRPEGFEISIGGGRIDRVDVMEDGDKVYVKVIDYKTGHTSFDLLCIYHGLQMQLMVYLDGAMQTEEKKCRDKEIIPAGIFYYNVSDPMITEKINADVEQVNEKILKNMKMNGLVMAEDGIAAKIDRTLASLPVSLNKDGSFRKTSSVAGKEQFHALGQYVRKKIGTIQQSILNGEAEVNPYELGNRNACEYCPYKSVCGFDRKIPGYEYRRLKKFKDEEVWRMLLESEKGEA